MAATSASRPAHGVCPQPCRACAFLGACDVAGEAKGAEPQDGAAAEAARQPLHAWLAHLAALRTSLVVVCTPNGSVREDVYQWLALFLATLQWPLPGEPPRADAPRLWAVGDGSGDESAQADAALAHPDAAWPPHATGRALAPAERLEHLWRAAQRDSDDADAPQPPGVAAPRPPWKVALLGVSARDVVRGRVFAELVSNGCYYRVAALAGVTHFLDVPPAARGLALVAGSRALSTRAAAAVAAPVDADRCLLLTGTGFDGAGAALPLALVEAALARHRAQAETRAVRIRGYRAGLEAALAAPDRLRATGVARLALGYACVDAEAAAHPRYCLPPYCAAHAYECAAAAAYAHATPDAAAGATVATADEAPDA